ncbi:Sugar phosphate isomerase/epimerase [Butyrivibrio fibrisolvens DSM 3071]|uniref:Sugar phosphate isomerase/epimerase n=1 Tax=Butyrivibrio fibrisolvens DSM 3071 TaxID=1121131 RepID=A0A1M6A9J4_BUTFI|nr:sugar phosphate isomerase/epimerase family protein [Butyrivibrio fibrisolvens]SHI33128.1 Sugar phosphate isomerase/epimerase [Butyrivibrio fibrisolvens DSM 3071]
MKLSISNIAWTAENDEVVYKMMKDKGFSGLEIAPTRIFPDNPYDHAIEARKWAEKLFEDQEFKVSSMQSIWYGRQEKLFGSEEERDALINYTKKAIDFAKEIGCGNLVFGCPRNRNLPEGADDQVAIDFFKEIGDYAADKGTVVAMEANPPIYNTNYINDTSAALVLIEKVDSKGFKLNLDMGTMIENGEDVSVLNGKESLINHVHVSEPGLKVIEKRELHKKLFDKLRECGYDRYISIEVSRQESIETLEEMMNYVKAIFG